MVGVVEEVEVEFVEVVIYIVCGEEGGGMGGVLEGVDRGILVCLEIGDEVWEVFCSGSVRDVWDFVEEFLEGFGGFGVLVWC